MGFERNLPLGVSNLIQGSSCRTGAQAAAEKHHGGRSGPVGDVGQLLLSGELSFENLCDR